MNKAELLNAIAVQRKSQNLRILKQRGTSNATWDKSRSAQLPGKRISKTGKVYWETRKNRSDAPFKKV